MKDHSSLAALPLDVRKGSTFPVEDHSSLAAVPLDVRKGCAFPIECSLVLAAVPLDVRKGSAFPQKPSPESLRLCRRLRRSLKEFGIESNGKVEPFRTSGGTAAKRK